MTRSEVEEVTVVTILAFATAILIDYAWSNFDKSAVIFILIAAVGFFKFVLPKWMAK